MPTAPPHACANRACPGLAAKGHRYCPACEGKGMGREEARVYDARRGSARERGYDGRWERFRASILRHRGICEYREDGGKPCVEPATDVHHVIPKVDGGPDTEENVQALCGYHHKATESRSGRRWGHA